MSTSTPSTKTIDHIVHLTPPGSVEEASKQFRGLGFKVIPGGTHVDGLTANALVVGAKLTVGVGTPADWRAKGCLYMLIPIYTCLIRRTAKGHVETVENNVELRTFVLQDGVYLELISFTKPVSAYPPSSPEREKRESHYWAGKQPGWIDYAFLGAVGATPSIPEIINERAQRDGSGIAYSAERSGGRERHDGRVLKWTTTGPTDNSKLGNTPFFCGDVTPREWRVPVTPPANTHHPSTVLGIANIRVLVEQDSFSSLSSQLTSVVGTPPISSTSSETSWALETVTTAPSQSNQRKPQLILTVPKDETEREAIKSKGPGIYEVAFFVERGEAGSSETPYGKVVWQPLS